MSKRIAAGGLALVAGALTAMLVAGQLAGADEGSPSPVPTQEIQGQALIDQLDLPVIDPQDTECRSAMDFDEVYYCLDQAGGMEEALALANQIRGIEAPTGLELEVAKAKDTYREASERVAELAGSEDQEAIDEAAAAFAEASTNLHELLIQLDEQA
jgi:hypothetical protein